MTAVVLPGCELIHSILDSPRMAISTWTELRNDVIGSYTTQKQTPTQKPPQATRDFADATLEACWALSRLDPILHIDAAGRPDSELEQSHAEKVEQEIRVNASQYHY